MYKSLPDFYLFFMNAICFVKCDPKYFNLATNSTTYYHLYIPILSCILFMRYEYELLSVDF
jgi:hypothetical protein